MKLDTTTSWSFLYLFFASIGFDGMLAATLLALTAAVDQEYQAYMDSLRAVSLTLVEMAVVGAPASLFMKEQI